MLIASRKPWTFRLRLIVTIIGFFISAFMVAAMSPGAWMFQGLTFCSFFFCLLQGVRLASGSISDEKREGTLGLLFLTTLRPIDIVAGKLFAILIPLLQPLLAFLPVLAISILQGGVTGGEIVRAALVLLSVLLYSISMGLFVSAASRREEETGNATILALLAAVFIPYLFSFGFLHPLAYLSPWTAFKAIPDPGYRHAADDFAISLAVTNGLSALCLFGAAWFLPRRWEQHKAVAVEKVVRERPSQFSREEKARIMDRNPGEWLAMRYAMGRTEQWGMNLIALALVIAAAFVSNQAFQFLPVFLGFGLCLFCVRLASQASFPLANARHSGAVEMLLSTPLRPRTLVDGQKAALRKQFRLPCFILLAGSLLVFAEGNQSRGGPAFGTKLLGLLIMDTVLVVAIYTVAVVGMWSGLREKSPNAAFFKTILWLLLVPGATSCFCPFIGPIVWIVLFLIANNGLSDKGLARLLDENRFIKTEKWKPAPGA